MRFFRSSFLTKLPSYGLSEHKPRQGFSLIEAAIVLGVVGLVIGGIWVAAAAVQTKMMSNNIATGINIAINNIQRLIPHDMPVGWLQYEVSSTHYAADMQIFPADWIQNQQVYAPNGKYVRVKVTAGSDCFGGTGAFANIYFSMTPQQCLAIASQIVIPNDGLGMTFSPSGSYVTRWDSSTWRPSWVDGACSSASGTVSTCISFPLVN